MNVHTLMAILALALQSHTPPESPGKPAAHHSGSDLRGRVGTADSLKDSLITLERRSWVAWQARDSAFFSRFLSDDHVEVGVNGVIGKSAVVAGVGSPACVVNDFVIDRFAFTRTSATVGVLTYHATQRTLCGEQPVPSPVWATSVYVLRDGRWLNAVYSQTKAVR